MIDVKTLKEDWEEWKKNNKKEMPSAYITSYPDLISFFKGKSKITESDFIIGIHMVYGWMPTALKVHYEGLEDALKAVNNARKEGQITEQEIDDIKSVVNNSVIGTSKLLHFISPEVFPIWDSKVCRYVFGEIPYNQMNSSNKYLEYLGLIKKIIEEESFLEIHKDVCDWTECQVKKVRTTGYQVTKMRAAEFIMFENASSKYKKKKK